MAHQLEITTGQAVFFFFFCHCNCNLLQEGEVKATTEQLNYLSKKFQNPSIFGVDICIHQAVKDKNHAIDSNELSSACKTINYEFLRRHELH